MQNRPPAEYSFGAWVRRRRKALDLTQQELAQKVGCSVSLIFKMESDERRPSRQIAYLLAEYLEIPPEQHDLFLKVARQQKGTEQLDSIEALPTPALDSVANTPQTHLPVSVTSLIGREHELRTIVQQLQDPACRLLTLSGPGGVGKTRLAMEVARQMRDELEQEIGFVSLAGTSAPEFIAPAIADSLGVIFSGNADLKAQLLNYLEEKQLLLVLDNLEHLLNGIELLDELLAHAPRIKLLATSREQLNLRAEWTFEVQGLPVPSAFGLEALVSNSAASLFIERARQAKANFTPSKEDAFAIARICQMVDGLPLGLELAATWVRTLSCPEIEIEIRRSLDFLTTSQRDVPERHRSLQAVFDYSWKLLTDEEKTVLKKLSVFQGGFPRAAAEQVAGANLSLLSILVGKSFIRRNDAQAGRYGQHELVRQYAVRRLKADPQEEASARDRHAGYYLGLWQASENDMKRAQQWETARELSADIDNFRAAWDWAISRGQMGAISQCLRTLLLIYDLRGWYTEGLERLGAASQILRKSQQAAYASALGLASSFQGWLHFRRGQLQEAREWFEQGLASLRAGNDTAALAEILAMYGPLLTSLGEGGQAVAVANESLALARTTGDAWHIAYALMMQGGILAGRGRFDEAYTSGREALSYFRILEDTRCTIVTLNTLGLAAMQLSRYGEAREFLQESLSLASPTDDPWSVGTAYGNLGIVELAQGNGAEAQAALEKSIAHLTDLGMLGDVAFYLTHLGEAHALQGDLARAEYYWRDGIRRAEEIQSLPNILANLIRLAQVQVERGNLANMYEVTLLVQSHPAAWGNTKDRAEILRAELESKLPEEQLQAIPPGENTLDSIIETLLHDPRS